jgi:hypothetical protein
MSGALAHVQLVFGPFVAPVSGLVGNVESKSGPFLGKGSWGLLGTALVAFLAVLALNWEAWCSKNIA